MRTSITGGSIALLAVSLAACDGTPPTALQMDVPEEQALFSHAGQPIETTFTATLVGADVASVTTLPSGIVIVELATFWESTGDWEGTFVGANRQTTHKNGVVTGQASFTFEGTILGFEGTVNLRFTATTKADGTFKGRSAILSGTEELTNLRGHGTNVIIAPGVVEGTFRVHFAP